MARNKILSSEFLLPLRKTAAVLLFFIVFFAGYNTFLLDRTVEDLRFSLEQTAVAYDLQDLEGVDILLDYILADEVMDMAMNSHNVANLEYTRRNVKDGKKYELMDYVKTSIGVVLKEKESDRNPVLRFFDAVNRAVLRSMRAVRLKIRTIFTGKETFVSEAESAEMYKAAVDLENAGNFDAALEAYIDFSSKYPKSSKVGIVRLRTAILYAKKGEYSRARDILRKVISGFSMLKEGYVARSVLSRLSQIERLKREEAELLSEVLDEEDDDPSRIQEMFYNLGVINLSLYNFEEARKFFKRAYEVDPESDLGVKTRFNYSWILKEMGEIDESAELFSRIAEDSPESVLAFDIRYQTADIYAREGEFEKANEIYIELAERYKGDPLAALCLFQAGASYMYDMNDDEKAQKIFAMLAEEYPESPFAKYLSEGNPIGVFLTYLVPRATRVVAWRTGGLLALVGYSGRIVKFRSILENEDYTIKFNEWLRKELPDTLGSLYVDITGVKFDFMEGIARGEGNLTMGRFDLKGEAEGKVQIFGEDGFDFAVTKAFLEKIPILPMLINNSLRGLLLMIRKHFPIVMSAVRMEEGQIVIEGMAPERMVRFMRDRTLGLLGNIDLIDFETDREKEYAYSLFREKFSFSDFSEEEKLDEESLFFDFFTRMNLYTAFKLMETVKDTKLDYERSIRTLGRLLVKRIRFRLRYTEDNVNISFNRLMRNEFPWIVDEEYLFDVKGFKVFFKSGNEIEFESQLTLGKTGVPVIARNAKDMNVKARASMEIDDESGIPFLNFTSIKVNGRDFSVERANMISEKCASILKDTRLPFSLDRVLLTEGEIMLEGRGARDLLGRIFSDPHLFVIFQIRSQDLSVVGIERLRDKPGDKGDYWRPNWEG